MYFQFQTRVRKDVTGGRKHQQFWKRWLKLPRVPAFAVSVCEKFIIKKREDPTLKVTDDGQGQLGHLQRELVPVLACFPVLL